MYVSRVEIKCFLGFKDLGIDLDPHMQLIAGPNNAGKSSLLRLLATFFSDPSREELTRMQPLNDYYKKGGPRQLSIIQANFAGLTAKEKALFSSALLKDGTFWIRIRCGRGGKITYEASRKASNPRLLYQGVLDSLRFVMIPTVRISDAAQSEEDQSLLRLYDVLESVLIRSRGGRKSDLQKEFEEKIKPVERLVEHALNESVKNVAAELPFRERELGIRLPDPSHALRGMLQKAVITSKDSIEVPISQRGTGFQSAMVLGILRHVASRSKQTQEKMIFGIEEPEAFLHPQAQRAMARILEEISADAQLLITTHSPILVDSFPIGRIVRIPLSASGTEYKSATNTLSEREAGQMARYCDASKSELVFANSVIIVEGPSDKLVIDYLLERITGSSVGHHALGIAVVDAASITNIGHFVKLADLFGVQSYILTDKDGVHKAGRTGQRELLNILKQKKPEPQNEVLQEIRRLADEHPSKPEEALSQQKKLNDLLEKWDAFVLASDLEGLLVDAIPKENLAKMLGPTGLGVIDDSTEKSYAKGELSKEILAEQLGSKGWNSQGKKSGKLKPHAHSAILREYLSARRDTPAAVRPLYNWLSAIVARHRQPSI